MLNKFRSLNLDNCDSINHNWFTKNRQNEQRTQTLIGSTCTSPKDFTGRSSFYYKMQYIINNDKMEDIQNQTEFIFSKNASFESPDKNTESHESMERDDSSVTED